MGTYISNVNGNELVFLFKGEMDTFTCLENGEKILSLVKEHKGKIVFDLKGVSYIASSFISLFGSVAAIIGKDKLTILNANSEIKKILKRLGITDTFIVI